MNWNSLKDTETLQESVDKQIANTEIVIVLSIVALVTLVALSAVVIPAMSSKSESQQQDVA